MITHRPCGACRALVPVGIGCTHWRIELRKGSLPPGEAAERRRARQRALKQKARDDAKRRVDEFRRTMTQET